MRVLIVDQFNGPTPYQMQREPMPFDQFCKEMLARPHLPWLFTQTELKEVDASFVPPMCTTLWYKGPDGNAMVWKTRWDTSG